MQLPILEKLKEGEKFDFETLADNSVETESYWDWWWNGRPLDSVARPEIIEDEDEVLKETSGKTSVDFLAYREHFNNELTQAIERQQLPCQNSLPRPEFHATLVRLIGSNSISLSGRPQIVFAGGGYGSGKTTVLLELSKAGRLPLTAGHMLGVDYFKLYIPEFSLIQSVADGRASSTVQNECKALASKTFDLLIENERSFIWDSSMSEAEATEQKISKAESLGYELSMVAVLTPVELAIRQAMQRARQTRRFPNSRAIVESNRKFRLNLPKYLKRFDEIILFARMLELGDLPVEIASKSGKANALEVPDQKLFKSALA